MTGPELLDRLRADGMHVAVDGDTLRVRGPSGSITPEVRSLLRGLKFSLIAALTGEPAADPRHPGIVFEPGGGVRMGDPAGVRRRVVAMAARAGYPGVDPAPRREDRPGSARAAWVVFARDAPLAELVQALVLLADFPPVAAPGPSEDATDNAHLGGRPADGDRRLPASRTTPRR